MIRSLQTWALLGALAASVLVNVAQWSSPGPSSAADEGPAATAAAREAALEELLQSERLGLTEEQIQRISECCASCCAEGGTLEVEVKAKQAELRAALETAEVNPERARALAEELGALQAQRVRNGVESVLLVRGVLNQGQIQALVQCFEKCCPILSPSSDRE